MIACNNNNMHNLMKKDVGRGYACYYCCMASSPVLLHLGFLVSTLFGTTTIPTFIDIFCVYLATWVATNGQ